MLKMHLCRLMLCAFPFAATPAAAASWPTKPVKVIVGIPAGQSTDMLMRMLAQQIEPLLGQPVVVENRAGAAGAIAMRQLASSPADGYTMALAFSASLSAIPHVRKDPGYTISQFAPVTSVAATGQVLIVPSDSPYRSVNDLVADARKRPGALNYGSAGIATMSHLAIELLANMEKLQMQQVLYQGGPQATVDLVSNRIQLYADSIPGATPNIRNGKVRALAVSTSQRQPLLPEVPTVAEQGFTGYDVLNWMGLVAPAGTPTDVLERMNAAVTKALRAPAFRKDLEDRGFIVLGSSRQEFANFIAAENEKWGKVLRAANIKLD